MNYRSGEKTLKDRLCDGKVKGEIFIGRYLPYTFKELIEGPYEHGTDVLVVMDYIDGSSTRGRLVDRLNDPVAIPDEEIMDFPL